MNSASEILSYITNAFNAKMVSYRTREEMYQQIDTAQEVANQALETAQIARSIAQDASAAAYSALGTTPPVITIPPPAGGVGTASVSMSAPLYSTNQIGEQLIFNGTLKNVGDYELVVTKLSVAIPYGWVGSKQLSGSSFSVYRLGSPEGGHAAINGSYAEIVLSSGHAIHLDNYSEVPFRIQVSLQRTAVTSAGTQEIMVTAYGNSGSSTGTQQIIVQ